MVYPNDSYWANESVLLFTGAGSAPGLFLRFGYATVNEKGWSSGRADPRVEIGSTF
jgi:hypothetical protein